MENNIENRCKYSSIESLQSEKNGYQNTLNISRIYTLPISNNKFYHEIIKINSIVNFYKNGWEREHIKAIDEVRKEQKVSSYKYRVAINAGIFGFAKTGKTYILQKLSKRLDKNYEDNVERDYINETYETYLGLNLHYLILNETKVTICFDTKGIGNIPFIKKAETGKEIADLYYDYFRVNDFIEKFILKNTSTIFYVIGDEDEKEKKYYEKIKNECPDTSNLIILHNLYKCSDEEIKKKKNEILKLKFENMNDNLFLEKYEKGSNNITYLIHAIIYNDNTENGKINNNKIFDFIEKRLIFSTKYSKVNNYSNDSNFFTKNQDGMYLYILPFKEFLVNNSLNYFGFELKEEDIIIEKDKISIKKEHKSIIPDEVKINKFNPEVVKPKYLIKKNKKENKIIIILELSSYKDLKAIVEIKKNYYLIIIFGEVKVNIPEKAEKIYNNIEEGPIYLSIKLSFDKCLLKNINPTIKDNTIEFDIISSPTNTTVFKEI